eukprot:gnl/TRDRNA2_/TRDRNA2_136670_c0_seq1.p1 gnl/TRDRNA2_/TRDRNA2_136670_c0~~gnl/TRDRNA2_/TRDRNA2_136670_c0_seq1.p1  ORF type:complete len:230 (+),score=10.59 gnl/TRDRNA2_/TRDRNA2_136670_c0_seq1:67-690(+)
MADWERPADKSPSMPWHPALLEDPYATIYSRPGSAMSSGRQRPSSCPRSRSASRTYHREGTLAGGGHSRSCGRHRQRDWGKTADCGVWGSTNDLGCIRSDEAAKSFHRRTVAPHVVEREPPARSIAAFPGYDPARDRGYFELRPRPSSASGAGAEARHWVVSHRAEGRLWSQMLMQQSLDAPPWLRWEAPGGRSMSRPASASRIRGF